MKDKLFSMGTIGLFMLASTPLAANNNSPKPAPAALNIACQQQHYRAFDFWVGQWEVKDKQGKVLGINHIQPILNGCGLSENWRSQNGFEGKSYNFYDNQTQLWHQTWIDTSGGILYLNGGLQKDSMVLKGTRPGKSSNGISQQTTHRITWTPLKDGRVRQYWESSVDAGKTWKVLFEGFYSKK
ncbi:hypothetical protein ACUR5C_03830 [Aliikangiella sp. IMCC44653]